MSEEQIDQLREELNALYSKRADLEREIDARELELASMTMPWAPGTIIRFHGLGGPRLVVGPMVHNGYLAARVALVRADGSPSRVHAAPILEWEWPAWEAEP